MAAWPSCKRHQRSLVPHHHSSSLEAPLASSQGAPLRSHLERHPLDEAGLLRLTTAPRFRYNLPSNLRLLPPVVDRDLEGDVEGSRHLESSRRDPAHMACLSRYPGPGNDEKILACASSWGLSMGRVTQAGRDARVTHIPCLHASTYRIR